MKRMAMPEENAASVMERTASYSREVGALDALSLLGIKTANLGLRAMRTLRTLEQAGASPAVTSEVMRSLTPAVEGSVVKQIAQRQLPGISPPTAEYAKTLSQLGIVPNVKAEAPQHAAGMQRLYDRFVGSGSLRG